MAWKSTSDQTTPLNLLRPLAHKITDTLHQLAARLSGLRRWLAAVVFAAGLLLSYRSALAAGFGYEAPNNSAYDPPASYYNAATGTGATLRMNLHNIISAGFVARSYGDAKNYLPILCQDPNNTGDLIRIYTDDDVPGVWVSGGVTWNREHLWPQSLLGVSVSESSKNAGTDEFELKPCDSSVNSGRSNDGYGLSTSSGTYNNQPSYFFPGDEDKGDIARSMFYMATRYYDGSGTPSTNNLSIVSGTSLSTYQMGDLDALLHWVYEDGVDNYERRLNEYVYSSALNPSYYQGNRNPYIDHPEYVWAIFGTDKVSGNIVNNSQLSVGNDTVGSDGSSTATVSLGRIMVNGTFGASNVAFNKTGADPTTFDLTTSGNAVTNAGGSTNLTAGVGQGIDFGTQSRTITVGLNASTATNGLKSGIVTLHNSDLTTSGAGHGSADANDTINISGAVLSKRSVTPSESNVNFGSVVVGANVSNSFNLTTTGDDNSYTRVNVAGTSSTDANGMQITGSAALFNSASSTSSRSLGGMLNTVGNKSGSLSLAVTTAENGGAGLSGEGTYSSLSVGYSATVLNHADASFSSTQDTDSITINLGSFGQSTGVHQTPFNLYNLVTTAGFTAGLDLNSVLGSGDTGALSTTLSTFHNLAANGNLGFQADLNTTNIGNFSATYSLGLSDYASLPGAVAQATPLTLTLTGVVTKYGAGDFNLDHHVDAADIAPMLAALADLNYYETNNRLTPADLLDIGDVNGDGAVSYADMQALLSQLNAGHGSSLGVPEPSSLLLLSFGGLFLLRRRFC
ncbi:MAG TPA: endonuclease [Pirellulales bacterium]|nr:endonuclease [Pirellulales bacterium]